MRKCNARKKAIRLAKRVIENKKNNKRKRKKGGKKWN